MRKDKQEFLLGLFKSKRILCTREGEVISFSRGYPTILKASTTKNGTGYKLVCVHAKERRYFLVHQIIFLFFKGQYSPELTINHIDGKKDNNCIDNLELTTRSGQLVHAHKLRLIDQKGEKNPASKLTWEKVDGIRERLANGETQRSIAKEYGVHFGTISMIYKNRTWRKDAICGV